MDLLLIIVVTIIVTAMIIPENGIGASRPALEYL